MPYLAQLETGTEFDDHVRGWLFERMLCANEKNFSGVGIEKGLASRSAAQSFCTPRSSALL